MRKKRFNYVHFTAKVTKGDTSYKLPPSCFKDNRTLEIAETSEDFLNGLKTIIVTERMSVGRKKYLERCGFFNK